MFSAFSNAVQTWRSSSLPWQRTRAVLIVTCLTLFGLYFVLYGYNSIYRVHFFPNDPMNYVDVARNIAAGNGAVQSTIGFNQELFSADDPVPTPLTSQPILYSLIITLPGTLGLPIDTAALVISTMCYAATVLLAYTMAESMYDRRVALLAAGSLLVYYPLRQVMSAAFSETVGIVFVLATLALLDRYLAHQRAAIWALAAGLCGGLAFATRYAFVIVLVVAGAFVVLKQRRAGLRTLCLLALGSCLPIGLTVWRNYMLLGELLPTPPLSTRAWTTVVGDATKSLLGHYTDLLSRNGAVALLVAATAALGALALYRRELRGVLRYVLLEGNRGLLALWTIGYLGFMVYQRSRYHFDPLNARLTMPAGVVIVVLWSAFALRILPPRREVLRWAVLALALLACGRELWIAVGTPAYSLERRIARSERLKWIERNTDRQDLVIGDETVDVPFYFQQPAASFAHFPYNEHLSYERLVGFAARHCDDYRRVYFVVRDKYTQPEEWQENYGSFVTDLVDGRLEPYSGIQLEQRLADATVFRVRCGG